MGVVLAASRTEPIHSRRHANQSHRIQAASKGIGCDFPPSTVMRISTTTMRITMRITMSYNERVDGICVGCHVHY